MKVKVSSRQAPATTDVSVRETRTKETLGIEPSAAENDNAKKISRWFGGNIGCALDGGQWLLQDHDGLEEIRLRIGQPLQIRTASKEYFLSANGRKVEKDQALIINREDLLETLEKMTYSSIYAAEENLRQGFLTLPGGHRVGIMGETIVEHGKIRTLRNISALNFRYARDVQAGVVGLLRQLIDHRKSLCHTLIISPPRAGKTTILRLLIRHLSDGVPLIGLEGQTVGVVDERSEIAGMWQGQPAFDLGCRTDVLDRCPKSLGVTILIRSMSPSVVAVDELGGPDDVAALADAQRCGVRILATAHAGSLEEMMHRPRLQELIQSGVFEKIVVLSRKNGPGTIEGVIDLAADKRTSVNNTVLCQ